MMQGADRNLKDNNGISPMDLAINNHFSNIAEELVNFSTY